MIVFSIALAAFLAGTTYGQSSCQTASNPAPSVADGYVAKLVAGNLSDPRGIKFDSEGALLVVDSGNGVVALTLDYSDDGCISVKSQKTVIDDGSLNHGIAISDDGKTLYASSSEAAYSWDYNAKSQKTTSNPTTLVTNMTNSDHTTRTLLLSRFVSGYAPHLSWQHVQRRSQWPWNSTRATVKSRPSI